MNLMIKANCPVFISKIANQFIYYLFIHLSILILVKYLYRSMFTLNTFYSIS